MNRELSKKLFFVFLLPQFLVQIGSEFVAELTSIRESNDRLRAENDAVAAEIESLESGSGAVEERARMRLGMVRKDEVLFRFVPKGEKKDIEADLIRESGKKGKPNYFAPKRSNLYTDGVIPPKHESGK